MKMPRILLTLTIGFFVVTLMGAQGPPASDSALAANPDCAPNVASISECWRDDPAGTDQEVPPSPEQLAALRELSRRVDGKLRAEFNPRNGTLSFLLARGSFLSDPSSASARAVAGNFLLGHADLFAVSPEFVSGLVESRVFKNESSGVTHVWYEQQYQGLDIFQSTIRIAVTADGEVLTVAGNYYPELSLPSIVPLLSEEKAMAAASEEVGPPVDMPPLETDQDPTVATLRELHTPTAELVVFPLPQRSAVLAWRVVVPQSVDFWEVVVDADTGAVLHVDNWTKDHTEGQVFLEHPDAGPLVTVPFTGPLPAPRDAWVGTSIILPTCSTCTNGNNAFAGEDRNDDLSVTAAFDADGHFNFGFANSYALTGNPDADQDTSITNLFYLNNVSHDYFYQLGFTEAAGNFQDNNFGAGGLGGDPVAATTYTGWDVCNQLPSFNCRNNASFTTPPDGSIPIMQTFLFTSPPRDPSLDGDVVIHEYGHGVSSRLVGVGGLSGIQSGAMGEGWGDYFPISYFDDPVMGEYGTQNATSGIRRYAYDANPLTYGDLCNTGCEVHDDGEIWAATLWDLRDFYISQLGPAAGSAAADELFVEGLMLTPPSPSMLNGRDAILQAELAMGGTYQADIWQVFASRGMGCSATSAGDSDVVAEAFDVPPCDGPDNDNFAQAVVMPKSLPYTNQQSTVGSTTEAGEPSPCAGKASTVWYRYTPNTSGTLTADTFGSGYDTALAVYTGAAVNALTLVDCNDDAVGLQSEVTFPASAGTTYHFQVGGFVGDTGNLVFNLESDLPPCPPGAKECFPNSWAPSTLGLAFDYFDQTRVWYFGEAEPDPGIWMVDVAAPHAAVPFVYSKLGGPNTDGGSIDPSTGNIYSSDFQGDLVQIDDNIYLFSRAGATIAYWETDPATTGNGCGGGVLDAIIDVAVDHSVPGRVYATSAFDNAIYELDLSNTSGGDVAPSPCTISAIYPAPAVLGTVLGIEYDCKNDGFWLSDWDSNTVVHTNGPPFDTVLNSFNGDAGGGYNSGVTPQVDGADPLRVWVTDFTSDSTAIFNSGKPGGTCVDIKKATVRAGSGSVAPGGEITIPVDALNVKDLGAFTVDVEFDPALLDATACTPDPDELFGVGDVVCNPNYDNNGVFPDVARCSGISPSGVSGAELALCDFTFQANPGAPAPTSAALVVNCVVKANTDLIAIPCNEEDGKITINEPPKKMTVRAGSGTAAPGEQVTIPVDALEAPPQGQGSFTIEVKYDTQLVAGVGCEPNPAGAFDFGNCSPNYAPGVARCTGISSLGVSGPELRLCDITFQVDPAAPFGETTPLVVNCVVKTDPGGVPILCNEEGGLITFGKQGDVNCDGLANVVDALFILQYEVGQRVDSGGCPLPPPPPDLLYVAGGDVDKDELTNVVDALFILQCEVGVKPGANMAFCQ